MHTLWQDVRYGLQMLAKGPGVSLAAVAMLALGIGANTTVFSAVKSVLFHSLPLMNLVWRCVVNRGVDFLR